VRTTALLLVGLALTLTGCETTAEKSAKLEKQALRANAGALSSKGLSIAHPSALVKITRSTVLHSSEGAAVVVTLRNLSAHALASLPLAITVHDAHGSPVYSNGTSGLAQSLLYVASIDAHGESTWIDDQVTAGANASSVTAEVGEGTSVTGAVPRVTVTGTHLLEEPGSGFGAKGSVVNHSAVAQRELVVYATARRGSHIVAAGRAVVAQVPANGTAFFQLFFIGDPSGAQLRFEAPATTLR
jgi:hypothetical protein